MFPTADKKLQDDLLNFVRLETKAERDEVYKGYFRSVASRVADGICIANLHFMYEQIGGGYVYQFKSNATTFQLAEGDLVIINQGMPEGDDICDGILMWINEINHFDRTIVLEKAAEVPEDREPPQNSRIACVLDKGFSDLNSGRLSNAIKIASNEKPDLWRLLSGELADGQECSATNLVYMPGIESPAALSVQVRTDATSSLDSSDTANFTERQCIAFERAISRRVSLIQGPPGTGKTRLLAQIVMRALREKKSVLISAYTHAAIDNLLEAVAALKPPKRSLLKIQGRIKSKSLPSGVGQMVFDEQILTELLAEPMVIGATVFQAFRMHQALLPPFDLVVIDEAGQLPIPHALASMICGNHYVLAGDHKQLAPIIKAHEPDEDVAKSIFERLHELYPEWSTELNVTFRMNHEINKFPSEMFYGGNLTSSSTAAERTFVPHYYDKNDVPTDDKTNLLRQILTASEAVTFVEVPHTTCSKISRPEADVVSKMAYMLLTEHEVSPSELAIISPHKQHNAEIRKRLAKLLNDTPGWSANSTFKQLAVDTVEKMQGREREVIILSLCASKKGYLQARTQFLYKPNRLNVAITRSRTRLIVVASKHFFPSVSNIRVSPKIAKIFCDYYNYLLQRHVLLAHHEPDQNLVPK